MGEETRIDPFDNPPIVHDIVLTTEESPPKAQEEMQNKAMQEGQVAFPKKMVTLGVIMRHKETQSQGSSKGDSLEFDLSKKSAWRPSSKASRGVKAKKNQKKLTLANYSGIDEMKYEQGASDKKL